MTVAGSSDPCDCGTRAPDLKDHARWCMVQPPSVRQPELQRRETLTSKKLLLVAVEPQPTWIDSSGRWHWSLPERARFPGCCTSVVTASREWWEYAPSEAKPHPMAEGVQLRDNLWYWAIPTDETNPRHTLDCDMVKHPNCTRCNCGSSIDPHYLEHVRQSPQGSVPAIGAPTALAAPGEHALKALHAQEPAGRPTPPDLYRAVSHLLSHWDEHRKCFELCGTVVTELREAFAISAASGHPEPPNV